MGGPFDEAMAARRDEELLEIITAREGTWREEALAAAASELTRRGIPLPSREEANAVRDKEAAARADVPLEPHWMVAAILMPLLIFPWFAMAGVFERQGYLAKARTLRRLLGTLLLIWVGMFLVIAVLDRVFHR